jgi:hypothetical protein
MHMDLYHLREEAEPSDRTALEAVVDHIKAEMARLNVRAPPECYVLLPLAHPAAR